MTDDLEQRTLPGSLYSLIGREKEVALVQNLLYREDVRLLTLMGPGGVGKTRVALQVATELQNDFAEARSIQFDTLRDPDRVISTIAQSFGLTDTEDWPLEERLLMHLYGKRLLLLLDNFEHVGEAAPKLKKLLETCPGLKILVTSQEPLRIHGVEHVLRIKPLTLPDPKTAVSVLLQNDAVRLFLQYARAIEPGFPVTSENIRAIAEICALVDGLPLAIGMVAGYTGARTPPEILALLREHLLPALESRSRGIPARHQRMQSTLDLSYSLLDTAEQCVFRYLSIFEGGCSLEAAKAALSSTSNPVFSEEMWVLGKIRSLIDKSFLEPIGEQETRYQMLRTAREYGLEHLKQYGEEEIARSAHASYYLTLVERVELELNRAEQKRWLDRLEYERDNLREALRWWTNQKEAEKALRLGSALWQFWWKRGYMSEGQNFFKEALPLSSEVGATIRAKALNVAGTLAGLQGDFDQAEKQCGESLALFRKLGDSQGIVNALWLLGYAAVQRGDYVKAHEMGREALEVSEQVNDRWSTAHSLEILVNIAFDQGTYPKAQSLVERSLTLFKRVGDPWGIGRALWLLSLVTFAKGDLEKTWAHLEESLKYAREIDDKRGIAYSLVIQGFVAVLQKQYDEAVELFKESTKIHRVVGDQRGLAWVLYGRGWISLDQGNDAGYTAARGLFEGSLKILIKLRHRWFIALCLEGRP